MGLVLGRKEGDKVIVRVKRVRDREMDWVGLVKRLRSLVLQ